MWPPARNGAARSVRAGGARRPRAARLTRGPEQEVSMVKEVYFFTEMGYTAYPQEDARRRGHNNLMFPNEHFSPERAQQLYAMYFEELQYCTESGFDAVMIKDNQDRRG